jgi:hypothetical protein
MSARIISLTATIANGASLSGAVSLEGATPLAIVMPSAWTAANLTFQASEDESTYNDMYDYAGTEVTVTAAASRHIWLSPNEWVGAKSIKVRSGTTGTPVNQGAARTITILARQY